MMRFQNEFVGDLDPPSLRRFGQVIRRRRWRCFHLIVGVNQVRGGEFGAAFTRHRNGSRWRGRHHAPECRVTASYRRRNLPSRPLRLLSACCGVLAVLNWGSVGLLRLGGGVQLSLDLAKIGAELCLAGRHNSLRAATPGIRSDRGPRCAHAARSGSTPATASTPRPGCAEIGLNWPGMTFSGMELGQNNSKIGPNPPYPPMA